MHVYYMLYNRKLLDEKYLREKKHLDIRTLGVGSINLSIKTSLSHGTPASKETLYNYLFPPCMLLYGNVTDRITEFTAITSYLRSSTSGNQSLIAGGIGIGNRTCLENYRC